MAKIKAYISELTARDLANGVTRSYRIAANKGRVACVEITFSVVERDDEKKEGEGK